MNKILKVISYIAVIGGAVTAGAILAKNGKFDEIIRKYKEMQSSKESDGGSILENSVCMIAEAFDDSKSEKSGSGRKSQKSYDESEMKAGSNGRH